MTKHLLWIDGKWEDSQQKREITAPYDGRPLAQAAQADATQLEHALQAAQKAQQAFRKSSAYIRSKLLAAIAQGLGTHRADLVEAILHEAGKPRSLADVEISRAIQTFTVASEECKRFGGERMPVDLDPAARAYAPATARWVPRGPVLAISPFNFPLNLAAHKVAPALASGCAVILKPPPQAPGAAKILTEIFQQAAQAVSDSRETVPPALLQLVHASNDVISKAVTDPRIATLSFTGSDQVGWRLQGMATRKRVLLELGGNAAVIVHQDADLTRAAARCAVGAFAYAGQVCISVQRIYVHSSIAKRFETLLLGEVAKLKCGDPSLPDTIVGPIIDQAHADRIMGWIDETRRGGARVLCGGTRTGNVITPTVIQGAKPTDRVNAEEVFGPTVTITPYDDLAQAIEQINASRFGLQAGVFSDSTRVIAQACDDLDVGGVIINEVPTFRADNMPYGGVKDSGLGREGVRYAMEELSERRVVVEWRG